MRIEPAVLENAWVRLEPADTVDPEEVRAAIDVDPDAWAVMVSTAHGAAFDRWWANRIAHMHSGGGVSYAVRQCLDGRIVGTSSLHDLVPEHRRVELGSTFFHPDVRGGPVNPASKRLMLEHAFASGAIRVEIITDALNARSQAAIAKLGAVREGMLRRHKTTHTGRIRDTVMFAITDEDWPRVRDRLDQRLSFSGSAA